MAEPAVVAAEIAAALGEPNVALIQRIVARIGPDAALAFLAEALATEAAGGLLTSEGTRRRTPGGVFFYLVRGRIAPRDRWRSSGRRIGRGPHNPLSLSGGKTALPICLRCWQNQESL